MESGGESRNGKAAKRVEGGGKGRSISAVGHTLHEVVLRDPETPLEFPVLRLHEVGRLLIVRRWAVALGLLACASRPYLGQTGFLFLLIFLLCAQHGLGS